VVQEDAVVAGVDEAADEVEVDLRVGPARDRSAELLLRLRPADGDLAVLRPRSVAAGVEAREQVLAVQLPPIDGGQTAAG